MVHQDRKLCPAAKREPEVLPYKSVIPVKENDGFITFYAGRVRVFRDDNGDIFYFKIDQLKKI